MSDLDPVAQEVVLLSRSGYPLILCITQEEHRVIGMVEEAARACQKHFSLWSVSRGYHTEAYAGANAERRYSTEVHAPDEALSALASMSDPGLVVLLDLHGFLREPAVTRRLYDSLPVLVDRKQSIVIIASDRSLPPLLEKEVAIVDVPLPGVESLKQAFFRVSSAENVVASEDVVTRAVRSALGLSLHEAERVFRKIMVQHRRFTREDVSLVVEEKKHHLQRSETLSYHPLQEGLTDVGGLDELKRWLKDRSRAFGEEARSFGLPSPKGLLLLGVQGCGKSLSAKAVANLWSFPLLRLDLAAVFGGDNQDAPEASLRQAVKVAERLAPVVLWVDEIEKGFGLSELSSTSSRVFGSFLTWLSEKKAEVFVVATANSVSQLPPELLRRGRFDDIFFVDLPNVHERLEILRIHLTKRHRNPEDFPALKDLAERAEHFSGAELEQLVIAALYRAFSLQRELKDEDLVHSLQQMVPLYATYEDSIKALRDWARTRARAATSDASILDLFSKELPTVSPSLKRPKGWPRS